MLKSAFFRKYLLPGFVFQSIIIGGGYGTGRELVEFFMTDGPFAGLLGMMVSTAIWSAVLALAFDLVRLQKTYDYRSFLGGLLGRGWIAYEVVYVIGMVLVVSVIGSASGELMSSLFGLPNMAGIVIMLLAVAVLAFYGTSLIERFFSLWSVALFVVFIIVISVSHAIWGDEVGTIVRMYDPEADWMLSGARYAAYNVGLMPAMLFTLRHLETRREAMVSGVIAGIIAMFPGVVLYLAMLPQYPDIVSQAIPADYLLTQMETPVLKVVFQIILFGTFIETGVGIIHGFNERIAGVYRERGSVMPSGLRAGIAVVLVVVAVFIADAVGIIGIIADGYGVLTWGYWIVFVLPVITIGVWRLVRPDRR